MITFGLSAPIKKVQSEKGFTVDAVTAAARPNQTFVLILSNSFASTRKGDTFLLESNRKKMQRQNAQIPPSLVKSTCF